jgi:hypothetical protein
MGELTFIDSTGIALLISALRRDGAEERLRFLPSQAPAVTRVLQLTGVEDWLPLVDGVRDETVEAPQTPSEVFPAPSILSCREAATSRTRLRASVRVEPVARCPVPLNSATQAERPASSTSLESTVRDLRSASSEIPE